MKTKSEVLMDAKGIENLMRGYSGEEGGHFGFIAQADGKRHFFSGGNSEIIGCCIAEALANLVTVSPVGGDKFIDGVCEMAKDMARMIREKQPQ